MEFSGVIKQYVCLDKIVMFSGAVVSHFTYILEYVDYLLYKIVTFDWFRLSKKMF